MSRYAISKAAAALGACGGKSKSEAKAAAARANGGRGGRPCYAICWSPYGRASTQGGDRFCEIYRFARRSTRDAWIAEASERQPREAVALDAELRRRIRAACCDQGWLPVYEETFGPEGPSGSREVPGVLVLGE